MNRIPTISVLVPVRGSAPFLARAVDSLRSQSVADWEALLFGVDGATLPAFDDPRLRCIDVQATNQAEATAAAAAQVRGEFLCVLDGDDLLDRNTFAALLAAFDAQPGIGMAYSQHLLVDVRDTVISPGPLCELPYSPDALLLDFMTGPLQLMRREAFAKAGGFNAAYPDATDYDLCLRLSETCAFAHVPQPLYRKRVHPQSPAALRWVEQIEDRYRAFAAAVRRRGLDAQYDCALEIDSWHILQPLRPFGGAGNWG
ncbi:glycosyltransferase [Thermomonas sp. HDW16]|uniref:glycosyltransferase n=1 Tax=Thermomonas sp. HDW16 TaxID=2714945 RepID=UPI00140900FD|nr:glycosyltransferase [Thermomonas sp. HDW16]QIL19270.1 glycosyltransferase [Thermomonas sp. HDW16]